MQRFIAVLWVVGCFYNGTIGLAQAEESVESLLAKFENIENLSPEARAELKSALAKLQAEQSALQAELNSIMKDVGSLKDSKAVTNSQLESIKSEITDAERNDADVALANEQMKAVMSTLDDLKDEQGNAKLQLDVIETKIKNLTEMQRNPDSEMGNGAGSDDIDR